MTIIGPERFACMNCGSLRPWNAQLMAYEPCSCQLTPSPDARVFTVTALNPIPTVATMTQRVYLAGQALMAFQFINNPNHYAVDKRWDHEKIAKACLSIADAILKANEEKP